LAGASARASKGVPMSMVSEEPSTLHLEEHRSEATSVVVHHVPAAGVARFLELQRGITRAVEQFAGYRRTDIYPPAGAGLQQDQWVVVVQFDDRAALEAWLASPQRGEWTKKLTDELGEYSLKTLTDGFGQWFVARGDEPGATLPASWKMAMTVWLGLYPTVMILTLLVTPYTKSLGMAVSLLIGNAMSVSILQWAVMPMLTRALRPWLKAGSGSRLAFQVGGAVLIVGILACWVMVFRRFSS
jgi:uncharacterized protein